MKRLRVKLGVSAKSDSVLLVFARQIGARMTGNIHYPNATALVSSVDVHTTAFETALKAVSTNTLGTTASKNAARADLEGALILLASHVEDHCNSDLSILQSSGFEARKDAVQHQTTQLGAVMDLVLTQQKGGVLNIKFKKAENSLALELRTRKVGDVVWNDSVFCSNTESLVTGFAAGVQYEVQTRAFAKSRKDSVAETTNWVTEMFWAI